MDFKAFKMAVATQFQHMQRYPMFRVDIDKDELWAAYLAAFPAGSNNLFRERTEYDCSCCRQFIRTVGDVVAAVGGELVSIWGCAPTEPAYAAVTAALSDLILSRPILSPFLHYEPVAGTDHNFEMTKILNSNNDSDDNDTPAVKEWTHFHVNLDRKFIKAKDAIPALLSECRSSHDVFLRSLKEITDEAIETVLDLIGQGSLYRGDEHKPAVVQFREAKRLFDALPNDRARDLFAWTADTSGAVARIRNTVIGTLLVDLSEGKELEGSVRSFEAKVAPTNYKRPSALITKGMVEKAKTTLEELGLTSALDRRYARIGDITINNLLFADRSTRKTLTGSVMDALIEATPNKVPNFDKIEEVPIDRFISEITPRADSIEVLFENRHQGNLVSLIAPSDPTARHLFKWQNRFSWSYVGEVADSIRERVKQAGGSVTGDLCCRLAWSNFDDLDFHMSEPGGYEIFFGNRSSTSPSGGRLDVDMNVSPTTREPVENIFYADRARMRAGDYELFVHQYNARETTDVGFEVEIDYLGTVHRFAYAALLRTGQKVTVATLRYTHAKGIEIIKSLLSSQASRTIWGMTTQEFYPVSALMLSPNCWDGRTVGNKHFFFMLGGCTNDGTARGFFNEFLREDLTPHRKVFEVVASKTKPVESAEQLSGLGFSSTLRNSVICRVRGSFTRTVKVLF